jgi:hypothetical protein
MPQPDDNDPLSALDFDSGTSDYAESDYDALDSYASTEPADIEAADDALDSQVLVSEEADEDGPRTCTVINPPETVSVSVLLDGTPERVRLSPDVTALTEEELAYEILLIARLARQKGLAAQQSLWDADGSLTETLRDLGSGADAVHKFMQQGVGLTTPEQAAAAQSELFASRYTS